MQPPELEPPYSLDHFTSYAEVRRIWWAVAFLEHTRLTYIHRRRITKAADNEWHVEYSRLPVKIAGKPRHYATIESAVKHATVTKHGDPPHYTAQPP
ncbi:hypothetical protein AGMMS49992_29920 [Clostridia bacterium]|nr:hypothetical protein AGMMS49992_29920 [Clostridia bacterium]